ncbi:hypothetical protein R1flu_007911 [Riccia fluitans]|uniref:Uncharacterized protein n=1 Tax=Riccia fluitans TaxID=41844 RepID=A0ABD1Z392_9MARC
MGVVQFDGGGSSSRQTSGTFAVLICDGRLTTASVLGNRRLAEAAVLASFGYRHGSIAEGTSLSPSSEPPFGA